MSVIDITSGTVFPAISAAITGSQSGDTIMVSAGSYVEDFPSITHSLTIQSTGGLAWLRTPSPTPSNGRAILNVPADLGVSLSVSGLALSGARNDPVLSDNGAAILFETGNTALRVTNSLIFDNQDGILTGGTDAASGGGGMTVRIDHSEIYGNGLASTDPRFGFDHNVYVGSADSLVVQNSYLHDALGGHEIKSRAMASTITGNRIQDGSSAATSYSIDLPDGGVGVVSGNTIEKGPASPNRSVVHFGGEGTYANSSLLMATNTVINDRAAGGTALSNQTLDANGHDVPATITGNLLYGILPGDLFDDHGHGPADTATGNSFSTTATPALDKTPLYQVTLAEPSGLAILAVCLCSMVLLIRRRRRCRVAARRA